MNTSYKTIWNEALGAWVAAAEIASARGKKSRAGRGTSVALKVLIAASLAGLVGVSQVAVADVVVGDTSAQCANPYNLTGPSTTSVNIGCRVNTSGGSGGQTSVGIGTDVVATGDQSVAIGAGAVSNTFYGIAIGPGAQAVGYPSYGSIAIGWGAISSNGYSVALGANSQAAGAGTFAAGLGAKAIAHWSTAIGTYSQAAGLYSTAVGYNAAAGGDNAVAVGPSYAGGAGSTAVGWQNSVTGAQSTAVGVGNQVTGTRSGAFGDPNIISGSGSYAVGNNNTIAQNNTFVVGNDVTTTQANSVVLGNASADRAATTVSSATIGGQTYAFAGPGSVANGVVSVGAPGAERQVINVAAGSVSATSTDAINGSQLYAVGQAIDAVQQTANAGWNLSAQGANTTNVGPQSPTGTKLDLNNTDGNVVVSKSTTSNDVTFNLAQTLNVSTLNAGTSVNVGGAGGTSITSAGITTGGGTGPSLTTTGIDAAGTTIRNVAAGTAATDAANVSQLPGQWSAPGSNTFVFGNPAGGGAPVTITNVAAGVNPNDAVNVSQLKQQVSGVTSAGLNFTDATGTNVVHKNLGDTLALIGSTTQIVATMDTSGATSGTSYSAKNVQTYADPVSGKLQVQMSDTPIFSSVTAGTNVFNSQGFFIGGPGSGGPSITASGINGGGLPITNIAAGTNGTDAVDVDQLRQLANKVDNLGGTVAGNLGPGSTYNPSTGGVTSPNSGGGPTVTSSAPDHWITGNPTTYTAPQATGKDSTAVGSGAISTGSNSVALGSNSTDGGRGNVVSVGSVGAERQVTNVAAGTQGTDAVNVNQLNAAITQQANNFNQQINGVARSAYAGVAGATALTMIPDVDKDKTLSVGVGLGSYLGYHAVAVGGTARITENIKMRAGVSTSPHNGTTFGMGASMQW